MVQVGWPYYHLHGWSSNVSELLCRNFCYLKRDCPPSRPQGEGKMQSPSFKLSQEKSTLRLLYAQQETLTSTTSTPPRKPPWGKSKHCLPAHVPERWKSCRRRVE
jgi:hypothetical protein